MLLETLTLCDFGLFRGEHVIKLNTQPKNGPQKPIVLFGGLNGAGKTTILSAIRLAIYGRQAIGYGTTQKVYDEYLVSKIHRNPNSLVISDNAAVSIEFLYYKLGVPTQYKVTRSWAISGKQVKEFLTIFQDGNPLTEFSIDQCQAFLNELIPLGVSELFFFDGEKIASLANEGGDIALRDAIKKLLGLDIIERLKSDLHIYTRRQLSKTLSDEIKGEISNYEQEYESLKQAVREEEAKAQITYPKLVAAKEELGKLEAKLAGDGGGWATRQSFLQRRDKLIGDKKKLEADVRDYLSGLYPLSLAPNLLARFKTQLQKERSYKDWQNVSSAVTQRLTKLEGVITKYISEASRVETLNQVHNVFSDLLSVPNDLQGITLTHDLANKEYVNLENNINELTTILPHKTQSLHDELAYVNEELANVNLQIELAPDADSLKIDLDNIKAKNKVLNNLIADRNTHLEMAKRFTWQALETLRKIRKLEDQLSEGMVSGTGHELATQTQGVLNDFAQEMTKRKIANLEQEFANTFARLARKSDINIRAEIDPNTFEVHLFNKNDNGISKSDLSAGEKQIYAVAMLEALAKTSGRKLPIIIDTPLGRLDSRHREKLVNNYFPHASHQVIILSTDTEVDESFYEALSSYIALAYYINYDETEGSSVIKKGYFWKSNSGGTGLTHAA